MTLVQSHPASPALESFPCLPSTRITLPPALQPVDISFLWAALEVQTEARLTFARVEGLHTGHVQQNNKNFGSSVAFLCGRLPPLRFWSHRAARCLLDFRFVLRSFSALPFQTCHALWINRMGVPPPPTSTSTRLLCCLLPLSSFAGQGAAHSSNTWASTFTFPCVLFLPRSKIIWRWKI